MASMYAALQTQVHGFSLRAEEEEDHFEILGLHRSIRSGRYPEATSSRASYNFILHHNTRPVESFEWVDIRGGTLIERAVENSDVGALRADLQDVSGILVFLDSTALASASTQSSMEIRRLLRFLEAAVQNLETELPIPIVAVLTKFDLIQPEATWGNWFRRTIGLTESLNPQVLAPLQKLSATIAASSRAVGTVIPVSCSATELNVQWPCLCVLFQALHNRMGELAAEKLDLEEQAKQAKEKVSNPWDWAKDVISSKWNGEATWNEISEKRLREARIAFSKFKQLETPREQLEKSFRSVSKHHFLNMKEYSRWIR